MNRLARIVESFSGKRIVVIGDAIADQFIYGEISRVSREAPVFILRHEHTETTPGGAGNCAANLAAHTPPETPTTGNDRATVTGHVMDTSGAALAGATVTVRSSGEHATADAAVGP